MPVQRCTKDGKLGWRWGKSGKCYTGSDAKAKASKQGRAIKASGFQEHNDINMRSNEMLFQNITTNFTGTVRNDTMEGREYLVAPMIMIVEGVHEGSNGPLYYPADEITKTPAVWNTKPIVVYHPQANGEGVSACDPDILTNRKVGVIMNTVVGEVEVEVNKKKVKRVALKAEAWLEADRMKKVDERVFEAVEKNETMELSTGLFTDNEDTEGEWNGEAYIAIARNYRPDHLALLPDLVGACSIEDGAGFLRLNKANNNLIFDLTNMNKKQQEVLRANNKEFIHRLDIKLIELVNNEISFDDIRRRLQSMLREKFENEEYIYVEDVFDNYFVYEKDGNLYKQEYNDVDGSISFKGFPISVIKETNYVTKNERNLIMNKEKLVKALIENESTQWGDEDKDALMELEEDILNKMSPVVNEKEKGGNKDEDKENKTDVQLAAEKGDENAVNTDDEDEDEEESVENMTAEEYIAKKVPNELKGVLQNGLASYNANKSRIIEVITSNKKNVFTKEQLKNKGLDELKALMALAVDDDEKIQENFDVLNYAGQGDPAHNEVAEEPMDVPVLNFEKAEE